MAILLIIGSIIFAVGSILDARYSSGQREQNPLFKNKRGYFDPTRYWLWSAGGAAMCWILTLNYSHWSMYSATAGVLGYLGIYRLRVALRTRQLLAERR